MNANQKRKIDRLEAIVRYLKNSDERKNSLEIRAKLAAMGMSLSLCTIQENLRELVESYRIHYIVESRTGSHGVPKMLYGYGPSANDALAMSWPREKDNGAQCNWLKANEWKRGQHGRDALQAALFGEVLA